MATTTKEDAMSETIDWSKFLPTGPLPPSDWVSIRALPSGSIIASTTAGGGASVRSYHDGHQDDGDVLAGCSDWASGFAVLIRHADGRWVDGYGPDGPCHERCGMRSAVGFGTHPCFFDPTEIEPKRYFCTAACRDRAAAKASAPRLSIPIQVRDTTDVYGVPRTEITAKASAPTVERRLAPGWRTSESIACFSRGCDLSPQHGYFHHDGRGACEAHAEELGVFASPITDDRGGMERTARSEECHICGSRLESALRHHGAIRGHDVGCFEAARLYASSPRSLGAPLPQWLIDERALMQAAPPTQVLPEFPRSKIERDNAMFRSRFQRSPRYVRGGR